jgi:nicotinamidase/pyrazinamidase
MGLASTDKKDGQVAESPLATVAASSADEVLSALKNPIEEDKGARERNVPKGGKALICVDVQYDFLPGGALAVEDGDQVIGPLATVCETLDLAIASADCHPKKTAHFDKWPEHCVEGTRGAKIHPEIAKAVDWVVSKGTSTLDDGYSAFEGKTQEGESLDELLRRYKVTRLVVGGLATDYCVRATVGDALVRGYKVQLLLDAVRAVNLQPGDGDQAIKELVSAGAETIETNELIAQEIEEAFNDLGW